VTRLPDEDTTDARAGARLRVGSLLAATALGLLAIVLLARWPTLTNRGAEHVAMFTDASGLDAGDDVRIGGVNVGTVARIQLDSGARQLVSVRFRVRKGVSVDGSTRARVTQTGLLGEPYLELRRVGAPRPLPPDTPIPTDAMPTLADAIMRADRLLARTDTVLGAIDRLAGADPLARLDSTLRRIDALVARADAGTGRALTALEGTSGRVDRVLASTGSRLDRVLDRTDRLVGSMDTTFRSAAPGLVQTQRDAALALRELRSLLAEVRGAAGQEGGLDALVRNLAIATENAARLSERLERDPSSVLTRRAAVEKRVGPRP